MPRSRRPLRLGAHLVLALACPAIAGGQILRGEVRAAETNLVLPFSTVVIQPGVAGRFTDDSGRFAFPELRGGGYRLTIRAIGYLPFDTVITVGREPIVLHVRLLPLAIELPPVTVVAARACVRPGPPARDSEPELAAIFDQLRDNAARYQLLSTRYPFQYALERRIWSEPASRGMVIDTLELRSDVFKPYVPGGLVTSQPGTRGDQDRILRLPTVIDLADSVFHRAHCFGFGGVDTLEGTATWRVDFIAADRLREPDVAGSAWLDSESYQLRRLVFRLTRPDRAARSLRALEATVAFGDLLPTLTVPIHITATSEGKGKRPVIGHEEQRLLRVHFLNGPPGNEPH